jgi:hypothetical protein
VSRLPRRGVRAYRFAHSASRIGLSVTEFRDTLSEGFSHFVTSIAAPALPAGAVAEWDLHPMESAAFSRRTSKADISYLARP